MMRGIRGYLMLFFIPLSFAATKERGKEKWLFADMNASRFVHLLYSGGKSELDAGALLHAAV